MDAHELERGPGKAVFLAREYRLRTQALEAYPELSRLAPVVRAHHEEFNGNGYPQGLKGEEIPAAARVIHVANSYHNMTSQMRYGAGMKPGDAQ